MSEKVKIQFEVPLSIDKEISILQDKSGHPTRVELVQTAISLYHLILSESVSQDNVKIQIVDKNGNVEFIFPLKMLKRMF